MEKAMDKLSTPLKTNDEILKHIQRMDQFSRAKSLENAAIQEFLNKNKMFPLFLTPLDEIEVIDVEFLK
ncbi:MAG TPA: hypothetical protein VF677_08035 [Flavobacterium sp.]